MLRHTTPCGYGNKRSGKILALFALMIVVLLGMIGLVIDGGLLMAEYRRTQNAADSAALAAAMELFRGNTKDTAISTANTFVKQHNGLANANVAVNIPPVAGPHTGNPNFVEVIITQPAATFFIQVVGISGTQNVKARAVAGQEAVAFGEGAIVIDPNARPGLSVDGGAILRVDGAVIVNSAGAGLDQWGSWIDWGLQQYALTTSNNSAMESRLLHVHGGVDVVANYRNYDKTNPQSPLYAGLGIVSDPLRDLPVPDATNGVNLTPYGEVQVQNTSPKPTVLKPGIYQDILITSGAEVVFDPGIYILSPAKPNQGLRINGDPKVTGDGVMFYVTGSNYLDAKNGAGYWDKTDDAQDRLDGPLPPTPEASLPPPPDPNFKQVRFATIDINVTGGKLVFNGLKDASSPFNNMLFFQRRRNMNTAQIQGVAGDEVLLGGAVYAKWARFHLAGGGRYDAQFVVGSMDVTGQATVVLGATGRSFGKAFQVYLVE